MDLQEIFDSRKLTENGDLSYTTTGNKYLDILFLSEFFRKNLDVLPEIGTSDYDRIFSMFIRDPRFGVGEREIGRKLMKNSRCSIEETLVAGRADDLCKLIGTGELTKEEVVILEFLKKEIENGNELVKKWMPRYSSKDLMLARKIAKCWGMNKQTYGHFIKLDNTVESKLSRKDYDSIEFSKLPSLALLKYTESFKRNISERFADFVEKLSSGEVKANVSTSTPYDIYKLAQKDGDSSGEAEALFNQLEKISGSWLPIIDTSASMVDINDSFGKAISIGHYLSKCSNYMPDYVVPFSFQPNLIKIGEERKKQKEGLRHFERTSESSNYWNEIKSIYTGDITNTNLGALMTYLLDLDASKTPEFLIILSDMEFDEGSSANKDKLMKTWRESGIGTKIVWWNFNTRHITVPELDSYGNIFISGYNPRLLKFLEAGFNGEKFLEKLIENYKEEITKQLIKNE